MSKTLALAATLSLLASPAVAEGWYADAGYQFISIDEDGVDADLGAITGHLGYNFNEYVSVEGEAGVGVQDETIDTFVGDVDVELNYVVGAYLRGELPISDRATLFARAGAVNAEIEVSIAGFNDSGSDTGIGYGAGGEFMVGPDFGFRGEYTRYDIEDLEADAFTIAAVWKF
ncbi:porin family protein [Henriciella sp. AS95]|uniref:porin family protein n=1 Tax=Henriciella sp. AS95 TaxID=3135782 RepID=UPI00317E870F